MRYLTISLVLYLSIFWKATAQPTPMGRFVEDVKIEPLEIEIPTITRTKLLDRGEILSMGESFFPITHLEIHFYSGEFPDISPEVSSLLFGAWKLGGTEEYPDSEFIQRLDYLGAKLQWKSEYEKSTLSVVYLQRDEEEIISILKSWLKKPRLNDRNLEIVRGQLREKILRRNDSVASLGMRKAKERAYKKHIRGRSESMETLAKVRNSDLELFHKRLIGSSQVNVIATGAKSISKLQKELSSILESIQVYKNLPYSDIDYKTWSKSFRSGNKETLLVNKDTNQSMILFTGAMPAHNHPDFYAIQLLNYIIGGGGFNSYFMTEIRNNRGLAYSTTSQIQFLETHGLFLAYSLTKNESVPEVVQLMEELLDYKTVDRIREDELSRAKNAIVNQFVFLFENQKRILSNQIRFDDHKMPKNYMEIYRDKIQSVTLAEIKRVGKEYFSPQLLQITIAGPKELSQSLGKKVKVIEPEEAISP